jgi:hypothetical protein
VPSLSKIITLFLSAAHMKKAWARLQLLLARRKERKAFDHLTSEYRIPPGNP